MVIVIMIKSLDTITNQDGVMYKPGARFIDEATGSTLVCTFVHVTSIRSYHLRPLLHNWSYANSKVTTNMLVFQTKLSLTQNLQVCCSGDILAALPEPTAEPVVEEPVKIQCPSYR